MTNYNDDNDIPDWARDAADKAWHRGFGRPVAGGGRLFDPRGVLTRAEFVTALDKFGLLDPQPVEPTPDPDPEPDPDPTPTPTPGDAVDTPWGRRVPTGGPSDAYIDEPWWFGLTIRHDHGYHPTHEVIDWNHQARGSNEDGIVIVPHDPTWYGVYIEGGDANWSNFVIWCDDDFTRRKALLLRQANGEKQVMSDFQVRNGQDGVYHDGPGTPELIRGYVHSQTPTPGSHCDCAQAEGSNIIIREGLYVAPLRQQNAICQGGGAGSLITQIVGLGGSYMVHSPTFPITHSLLVEESTLYGIGPGGQGDDPTNTIVTLAELAAMMDDPTVVQGRHQDGSPWHLNRAGEIVQDWAPGRLVLS